MWLASRFPKQGPGFIDSLNTAPCRYTPQVAIPIPYQLDILGGLHFENLIQELLIADLGLGVEAWGGSSDYGRDAYCPSELNFPNRRVTNVGPFVFQAKFISGANGAGARFDRDLNAAITKESELIKERIELKKWKRPKHYGLFTNAPITAGQRAKATAILRAALPGATITIQGAAGICGLLDANISVARAFPQLLSLRSLTDLLKKVVRNSSIQKSEAAIKEAEGVAQVFVPTRAYERAWQVLNKHNFVVLEGPPEMGKTAIAWMIAAVQLTQKWEAVDCDSPEEFFHLYDNSNSQVFVADDAFGTTEYEITRGNSWGRELHKVLPKLNAKHWLVWTSRGHILHKAIQEMSLQGKATNFPKPAEVIVNASDINSQERALMLYRHARAGGLEEAAKKIVRQNAATVIYNSHFTPERIKRFVLEELPDLLQELVNGEIKENEVSGRIDRAIEHPTERMEKAFTKLDRAEKWLLIAMLDCERSPDLDDLEKAYRRFSEMRKPIETQVGLLEEGFLQRHTKYGYPVVDWIHPSYRDLVISELGKDESAALEFLDKCSVEGIRLALSVAGGATGDRRFPLMSAPDSWDALLKRSLQLIRESTDEVTIWSLLEIMRNGLESAFDKTQTADRLSRILDQCCREATAQLDKRNKPIVPLVLKEILDSTLVLNPPPPMPSMSESLGDVEEDFIRNMNQAEGRVVLDASVVERWATTVSVVAKSDQRLLIKSGFPDQYTIKIERLCSLIASEVDSTVEFDSGEGYSSEISRMRDLSRALKDLVGVISKLDRRLVRTSKLAARRANTLERRQVETMSGPEPQDDSLDESRRTQTFDLDRLFADL